MSTAVYPALPVDQLKKEEDESIARELSWLLESLQETLVSLKSGLEDCYALLAPIEPGSTLVMSSARSESVKGHVTRVGTRIVRGTLHLRLKTLTPSPLVLTLQPNTPTSPTEPLILHPLATLRTLLNQSLDCVDITRWTGDRSSAAFISSQLRLLHSLIHEALALLKGPSLLSPTNPTPGNTPPATPAGSMWFENALDGAIFAPPLPENMSLDLSLNDSGLVLTVRVLEAVKKEVGLGERFAFAIGAQRRLEHDEMDEVFLYKGEEVRVREKVRVEGSADPSLLSLGAKLGALERTVNGARRCLEVVTGGEEQGDGDDD